MIDEVGELVTLPPPWPPLPVGLPPLPEGPWPVGEPPPLPVGPLPVVGLPDVEVVPRPSLLLHTAVESPMATMTGIDQSPALLLLLRMEAPQLGHTASSSLTWQEQPGQTASGVREGMKGCSPGPLSASRAFGHPPPAPPVPP